MTILGIVAEYDPFHNGHLYHMAEAQKTVRPDLTYTVLSPCLKQRGDFALLPPTDRAGLALEAGADAVFALPVLWTVRDAEHYALGAVSLLSRLGVTHLAFGAETDDLPLLRRVAELLESPSTVFERILKDLLSRGVGYPAALSAAVGKALPRAADLLSHPNNVLAVCYLRAILRLHAFMLPVPIRRRGNYHEQSVNPDAPSASALRGRRLLEKRIPDSGIEDTLLLSRLRSMSASAFAMLPDVSEGLENALRRAAQTASGREELITMLTGTRYPAARISRLCAYALLQVTREDLASLSLPENALLLGLKRKAEMTVLWKKQMLPVVSSFTEWKKKAHPADLAAWRLWVQCCRLPDTLPYTETIVTI